MYAAIDALTDKLDRQGSQKLQARSPTTAMMHEAPPRRIVISLRGNPGISPGPLWL